MWKVPVPLKAPFWKEARRGRRAGEGGGEEGGHGHKAGDGVCVRTNGLECGAVWEGKGRGSGGPPVSKRIILNSERRRRRDK